MTQIGSVNPQSSSHGVPTLSLPNGGGAIRGIGETFQANQFTGTGNFTIPIPTSPGRAGFGPSLNLQYSSGNGNGTFGLGWELSIPRITRKTEKGLPQYNDRDIFVLSGSEDLVPQFSPGTITAETFTLGSYTIQRYRPRTEGLFARIERWLADTGDVHWRVTTKDNVTSVYGRTLQARIVHPSAPRHIYEWLLEETFDVKGNHISYEYAADDPALRVGSICEEHRSYNQRYIRRICYGNLESDIRYANGAPVGVEREGIDHRDRVSLRRRQYLFEVVFDYKDGGASQTVRGAQELFAAAAPPIRDDAFSSFRAGFEVRTLRRCERVLMYHHFAELDGPTLVRSTWFDYHKDPRTLISLLTSITVKGHRKTGTGVEVVGEMPPVTFAYSEFQPQKQRYQPLAARGEDLPAFALLNSDVTLVDLFGDGLPDVLHTSSAGFRYWRNLGNGLFDRPRFLSSAPVGVTLSHPEVSLADMDGDGRVELLLHGPALAGYYETTPGGAWEGFRPYQTTPTFSLSDPNLRLLDLTGDGRSDALLTRDHHFLWFECLGESGYSEAKAVERLHDLPDFPDVYFDDPSGRLRLADMSGDGLADIVLLHQGRVDYWPNVGYGKFGRRITMGAIPDAPMMEATFDPKRLFLVDLDGTGCADLVYVEFDRIHFWFNQSGNGWSSRQTIQGTPLTHSGAAVQFADIFGTGTATLLWSYDFGLAPGSNYKALDFCGGVKPYVLTEMDNNMGATIRVRYAPSTRFALADRQKEEPWITQLPFPVHVVEKVETIDQVSKTKLVSSYEYHHGYFDGREREFRGFGRVDRLDTEFLEDFARADLHPANTSFTNSTGAYHLPPVLTKTWHHTGAYFDDGRELLQRYSTEFYNHDPLAFVLGPHDVEAGDESFEAHRVLRGSVLRTEIYGLDDSPKEPHPYAVTENRHAVRNLQRHGGNAHDVYLVTQKEAITHHYERTPGDPRVAHEITLAEDAYGNVTDQVSIAYPRRQPSIPEQAELKILYGKRDFINSVNQFASYYLGLECQSRSFEVRGMATPSGTAPLQAKDFDVVRSDLRQPLAAGQFLHPGDVWPTGIAKKLVAWSRTYFRSDAAASELDLFDTGLGRLPLGQLDALGIQCESFSAAFNPYLVAAFGDQPKGVPHVSSQLLEAAGYRRLDDVSDYWWIPSGRQSFNPALFYQCDQTRDPFGAVTQVTLDQYALLPRATVDALSNTTSAVIDYRVLQSSEVLDPNGARSIAAYDALGLLVATAVQGHSGEGDKLDDVPVDLSPGQIAAYRQDPVGNGSFLLGSATTRNVYDAHAFKSTRAPAFAASLRREQHTDQQQQARIQHSFLYCDGFGRSVQTKALADPGPTPQRDAAGHIIISNGEVSLTTTTTNPRWVASGWTVVNNKGNPVRRFEPFFSDTHQFEFDVRVGVSPIVFYDPVGRPVVTLHPNRTYKKSVFDAWHQETWDANDTSRERLDLDPDTRPYALGLSPTAYSPTWYEQRINGTDVSEQRAARLVEAHAGTPAIAHLDGMGRAVLTLADTGSQTLATRVTKDLLANDISIIDARGVEAFQTVVDLVKRKIAIKGADAGAKYNFIDVANKPLRSFDANLNCVRMEYDALQRPTKVWVKHDTDAETLVQQTFYGETLPDAATTYHRTRVFRVCDGAGEVITERYNFEGGALQTRRTFTQDYTVSPDWSQPVALEARSFTAQCEYNALGLIVRRTEPDGAQTAQTFSLSNLLKGVEVVLAGSSVASQFVTDIDYNARGQRLRIVYGNGVVTSYEYDSHTFRLRRVKSERQGQTLQDLQYTYDPVGNVLELVDISFASVFHNNQRIEPAGRYVYDAVYRLIEASGREHPGISACQDYEGAKKGSEPVFNVNPQPVSNGLALRNYRQVFHYDQAGNLELTRHKAAAGRWTRRQTYEQNSNRLLTSDAGCFGENSPLRHDANGNITRLPNLPDLLWDHGDRLVRVTLSMTNNAQPDMAYYSYDSQGQRARKVVGQGARRYERIYLGSFEVYREYTNQTLSRERSTSHIMDDEQRIAEIETRSDSPQNPERRFRYQLTNQLGSAMLEVDEQGRVISYEEYYPFGGTAYMAGINEVEIERKRYRYGGKERDDETGCYYFGARYYAPWLGRWLSCDTVLSTNLFVYSYNNPVTYLDPDGKEPWCAGKAKCTYDPERDGAELSNRLFKETGVIFWSDDPNYTATEARLKDRLAEENYERRTTWRDKAREFVSTHLSSVATTVAEGDEALRQTAAGALDPLGDSLAPLSPANRNDAPMSSYASPYDVPRAVGDVVVNEVESRVIGHGLGVSGKMVAGMASPASLPLMAGHLPSLARTIGSQAKFWEGKIGRIKVPYHADRIPDFRNYSFFDARLKDLDYVNVEVKDPSALSDKQQFRLLTKELKLFLRANPEEWSRFSPEQQKNLRAAFGDMNSDSVKRNTPLGFTWHHDVGDPDWGQFQLLDYDLHAFNEHDGGRAATGTER